MGRLVIGHQVQLQLLGKCWWQGYETHERVQVMCFTADLLDTPVQFTAQAVARKHCRAVTVGHAPEHFVQQVPALLAAVAGCLLQLTQ
ncbi:hypothetical protein D3C76_1618350 [compost metagenome]